MNKKMNKRSILFNYAIIGFLVGLMFPIGAWVFEMIIEGISISITNLPHIHNQNKLIFLIDSAPLVLSIFSLIGGFKQVNIIKISEELSSSFEELKGTKTWLTRNETSRLNAMEESSKLVDEMSEISIVLNNNTNLFHKGVKSISDSGSHIKDVAIASSGLINTVSDFSKEITNFSGKCLEETKNSKVIGDKGLIFVNETVENMDSILDEVVLQKQEFETMLSDVEEATETLNYIEEISSKTKNLAMNASIEAARAGEYGKSFNIIAKEVRQLSDMSKISTDSITKVFKNLNNSVDSISIRINKIEECISDARVSSKKMTNGVMSLIESLNISEKNMKKISDMTFEQKEKIGIIEQDSSEIRNVTLEMNKVLSQSEDMLKENEKLIHNLYTSVKDFTMIFNDKISSRP